MKVNIKPFYKNPDKPKYCRVNVEVDDYDAWNADHTLALIILPILLELKENKMGIPGQFSDVGGESYADQRSFDFYEDSYDEALAASERQWSDILDKMIWSFQQIALDEYEQKYHHGEAKYDFVKSDKQYPNPISGQMENTYQMIDRNPTEHWFDHVGLALHEERIQEGLDLFAKHFRSLWN